MVRESFGFLVGVLVTTFVFRMFDLPPETIATFALSFVVAAAAVIALSINRKSLQHQKQSRRWEASKDPLLRLATSLSDAIDATTKSVTALRADRGDQYDEGTFNRLRINLQHALDVHVALLSPQVVQAIKRYKEEDQAIQDAWNAEAINILDALEQSSRIQKDLLKRVNSSIKEHASF